MEVSELLSALDREISDKETWIDELMAELASAERALDDRRREANVVRAAVERVAGMARPVSDESWTTLSGVDAVERALLEKGPLYLREIADLLVRKGRPPMTTESVSANLTFLSQNRQSVINVSRGRWDYVRRALSLVEEADTG